MKRSAPSRDGLGSLPEEQIKGEIGCGWDQDQAALVFNKVTARKCSVLSICKPFRMS